MFFTKKKKEEVTLTIDIGSSSVGAALVSVSKDLPPKILYSTRSAITIQNESERSHYVASAVQALELLMKSVFEQHIAFHKSHIIFSSPWCTSQTKILRIENEAPAVVTNHIIDKLTKESEEQFLKESNSKAEIVEHKIISIKLNGYETSKPYNKKAKTVEVVFFVSIVQNDILESVRRVMEKHFHLRNNQMSSFSLAAFKAITGIIPDEHDFLIVDVRGEVTELSLVVQGAITQNKSFSPGKTALVKGVSEGSGNSVAASLFLASATFQDDIKPDAQDVVIKASENFKKNWLEGFNRTLVDMYGESIMPPTIFLIADLDVEVFFDKMLTEIIGNRTVHLLKNLNVKNYLEKSSVSTDQFLALESVFVTMV